MKRQLNPDLVREQVACDPKFPFTEHWVVLREQRVTGSYRELGIGPTEIEEIQETDAEKTALAQQIRETERELDTRAGIKPSAEPHLILTRDCFGFTGAVRLLIYSNKPFA